MEPLAKKMFINNYLNRDFVEMLMRLHIKQY